MNTPSPGTTIWCFGLMMSLSDSLPIGIYIPSLTPQINSNEPFKPSNHLGRGVSNYVLDTRDAFRGRVVPEPHIIKRFDLWINAESRILENLVIFLVGVERRIKADQVDIVVGKA